MRDDLPVGSAGTGATLLQRPAHNRSKIKAKVGGEDCKDRFACKCPVLLHFRLPITMIASYGTSNSSGRVALSQAELPGLWASTRLQIHLHGQQKAHDHVVTADIHRQLNNLFVI